MTRDEINAVAACARYLHERGGVFITEADAAEDLATAMRLDKAGSTLREEARRIEAGAAIADYPDALKELLIKAKQEAFRDAAARWVEEQGTGSESDAPWLPQWLEEQAVLLVTGEPKPVTDPALISAKQQALDALYNEIETRLGSEHAVGAVLRMIDRHTAALGGS